jgi:cytochrome c peroxidase
MDSGILIHDTVYFEYRPELLMEQYRFNDFVITEQEKQDVVNFLKSLTDWTFVCEERFSDPMVIVHHIRIVYVDTRNLF